MSVERERKTFSRRRRERETDKMTNWREGERMKAHVQKM